MSVDLGRTTIFKEFEALKHRWKETESIWKDVVRAEFSKDKWEPLDSSVMVALSALDRLTPILIQVREQCSGHSGGGH